MRFKLASSLQYFGKDQGVAAYTFRDERDLLWYSTVFSLDWITFALLMTGTLIDITRLKQAEKEMVN